jgi:hypothetical protein
VNLAYDPDFGHYVSRVVTIPGFINDNITYRQFYSTNLFEKIRDFIGLPQEDYHVVSIGIYPSIAQYNGFYTLDGYQSMYPLAYKQKFRTIIAPELKKSQALKAYFDDWGSRCYIYTSELPSFTMTKNLGRSIRHLDLDTKALRDLGGNYIFSAVEILNFKENHLKFLGLFADKSSVWKIYLYQVQ